MVYKSSKNKITEHLNEWQSSDAHNHFTDWKILKESPEWPTKEKWHHNGSHLHNKKDLYI